MYTTITRILKNAVEKKYAVIACSAVNMEMVRAVFAAATEMNAPIIFLLGQNMMRMHAKAELLAPMIRSMSLYSPVPVALCLDHGNDQERIAYSIKNGFSSIMFDGSLLPYEENVEKTSKITALCHDIGLGVEGELGHVGQASLNDELNEDWYTDPMQAKEYALATNVDCLAVAVGTAHGAYPKGFVPHINFEIIKEIRNLMPSLPLALHGGSGAGEENLRLAVESGINKINVVTDLFSCAKEVLATTLIEEPGITYMDLMGRMEEGIKENVKKLIRISGSENTARFYEKENRFDELVKFNPVGMQE